MRLDILALPWLAFLLDGTCLAKRLTYQAQLEFAAKASDEVETGWLFGKRFKPFAFKDGKENEEEAMKLALERMKKYDKKFMLRKGEKIELAYKKGRDTMVLTDRRYIHIDARKFSTKVKFRTIFYESILAFALETAGTGDRDSEMNLFTDMPGLPFVKIEFDKQEVDIFEIQKFLCDKVMGSSGKSASAKSSLLESRVSAQGSEGGPGNIMAFLSGDGVEVDSEAYEALLRSEETPVLQEDERVEIAFKMARDSMVLTDKRLLLIDVQGLTGKKIEYKTLPYSSIGAYLVETAGGFFSVDKDSEMKLWTTIPYGPMVEIKREFRKGKADIMEVQRLLSKKVLRYANPSSSLIEESTEEEAQNEVATIASSEKNDDRGGKGGKAGVGGIGGVLAYFGGDASQIDAEAAEQQLQKSTQILIDGEHVKIAFKVGRDMTLLTSHRIMFVDVQGTGTKVEYKSIPYNHIMGYAVQTAGVGDSDSEMMIWTDIASDPDLPPEPPRKPCENGPCPYEYPWPPRKKGMAYFEQHLRKGYADIFQIQAFLSEKVMGGKSASSFLDVSSSKAQEEGVGGVLAWLGDDASPADAETVEQELRNQGLLLDDESVELPFKVGRDLTVLTSKRVLLIDKKDLGKKVEYKSIPYKHMRGFSVESAGTFDMDAEMNFYTKLTWPIEGGKTTPCPCRTLARDSPYRNLLKVHQDLRKGKADIGEIQKFMARKLLRGGDGSSLIETEEEVHPLAWLTGANMEVDLKEAEEALKSEIDPFISGESLKKAYQIGRDLLYFTNKRLLIKDVQGLTGAKIEYESIPYTSVSGLSMETAGMILDVGDEMWLLTDSWGIGNVLKSFHKSKANITEVFELVTHDLL